MKVLIAAGGTGGHIYPALAIADQLKEKNKNTEIIFVGTKNGMESRIVPAAGYPFKIIRARWFSRKPSVDTLKSIKELILGMNDSRRLIKQYDPDVVIGTGGYVCGPVLYWAARKGKRTLIHEQNAYPGATNRLLAKYVDDIAVGFDKAKDFFEQKDKVFYSGNPVRRVFFEISKEEGRKQLKFDSDDQIVVSLGGSLGAQSINQAMLELIKGQKEKKNLKIVHITGKNNYNDFIEKTGKLGISMKDDSLRIIEYAENIPALFAAADLIVSRAGAMTVAEITASKTASVLVPYPYATGNHQEHNARSIIENDAGWMVIDEKVKENPSAFAKQIMEWLQDQERLEKMGTQAYRLSNRDSAERIVQKIETSKD
ncbi:MAG TPA: undecaprenyldiphospho-muramoylpentapeptide beta-N-acetylglucosaminyltransferase [Eubacteriaceae bacterium]|nr:undecaprenyldiphospho-muramoylpentapeptide beta-N-acetylglucosaminyltransferase [Eubacteriaceae bacterium]